LGGLLQLAKLILDQTWCLLYNGAKISSSQSEVGAIWSL
jgi:hypothetical protein